MLAVHVSCKPQIRPRFDSVEANEAAERATGVLV